MCIHIISVRPYTYLSFQLSIKMRVYVKKLFLVYVLQFYSHPQDLRNIWQINVHVGLFIRMHPSNLFVCVNGTFCTCTSEVVFHQIFYAVRLLYLMNIICMTTSVFVSTFSLGSSICATCMFYVGDTFSSNPVKLMPF